MAKKEVKKFLGKVKYHTSSTNISYFSYIWEDKLFITWFNSKEFMTRDELYYSGWTNWPFYPPRQNQAKRHQPDTNDPVAKHIAENANPMPDTPK